MSISVYDLGNDGSRKGTPNLWVVSRVMKEKRMKFCHTLWYTLVLHLLWLLLLLLLRCSSSGRGWWRRARRVSVVTAVMAVMAVVWYVRVGVCVRVGGLRCGAGILGCAQGLLTGCGVGVAGGHHGGCHWLLWGGKHLQRQNRKENDNASDSELLKTKPTVGLRK